jgi:hypothetical protein
MSQKRYNKLALATLSLITIAMTLLAPGGTWPLSGLTTGASAAINYSFPGRAEDLPPGYYFYVDHKHAAGIQGEGYDISGIRYDDKENRWTRLKPGQGFDEIDVNTKNEDWLIHGTPVRAIADGEIVRCWRNSPENPRPGVKHEMLREEYPRIGGGGNSLWVRHADGNYALYAHFKPGSIPASLCPNSKTFVEKEGESELPPDKRSKVKAGQMLGRVGNSGSSSNPHLHLHLQKSEPGTVGSSNAVALPFHGAWIKNGTETGSKDEKEGTPWTLLKGQEISSPPTAILPNYSKGAAEVARHGVPAADYQFTVDHAVASGYRLEWVDGFSVNGKLFFNVIYRPDNTGNWSASHNLTGAQYQDVFDKRKAAGFRLKQVDSYPVGNQIRYAAIFVKDGAAVAAYHGLSAADHQKKFDELTAGPWKPKNISVVSLGGDRFYTALYEKTNTGSSQAKSFLTAAEYQQLSDENKEKGRQLAYLNVYEHQGQPRFSAIWNSATQGAFKARHGLSGGAYQQEWEEALKGGLLTRAVTGYEDGNAVRYAAVWRK